MQIKMFFLLFCNFVEACYLVAHFGVYHMYISLQMFMTAGKINTESKTP